jgi:glycosyltransferase involved in cell wall biosynthesis
LLVKHCPPQAEALITQQLWWEYFFLPQQLNKIGCNILLNVDAGTVCRFLPAVTMSRDMLAFEPGEAARLGLSKARLRQLFLRHTQCQSLTHADGSIFLTKYAARVIQQCCGSAKAFTVIPHGVSDNFRQSHQLMPWPTSHHHPIRLLYVSPISPYKHQWHVIRAVELLRSQGFNLLLTLVGGSDHLGLQALHQQLAQSDPNGTFVNYLGPVPHNAIPELLTQTNIFVFASSCENMPNTLIEAMSNGLPIACSDRGPMPEVLQDGGVYFNPEKPDSIAAALEKIIVNNSLRTQISTRALDRSLLYSWKRCAHETFSFLAEVVSLKQG